MLCRFQTIKRMLEASFSNKSFQEESLKVNLNKRSAKLTARLLRFRDKDTRQIIFFIPSLQITSYGSTEEKAKEMLNFSIDEYFQYLTGLSQKKLEDELLKMGWKHVAYANKQYSKAFVSCEGELCNFNAVADEIEQLAIQV